MHTTFAGLEHLLFPELVQSSVILTNARGVYSNSLAEFALQLLAAKWFAMDVPRLLRAKRERRWDQYEVWVGGGGCRPCSAACQAGLQSFQLQPITKQPQPCPCAQVEELRGKVMGIVG